MLRAAIGGGSASASGSDDLKICTVLSWNRAFTENSEHSPPYITDNFLIPFLSDSLHIPVSLFLIRRVTDGLQIVRKSGGLSNRSIVYDRVYGT